MLEIPSIKSIDKSISSELRALNKSILRDFLKEKKKVPQGVKTKVYKRAGGKCEWPRCRKHLKRSEGEFHHWKDRPTERTTAFLCHMHHRDKKYKTHVYKVEIDMLGNKKPFLFRRRRIPIGTKTRSRAFKKKTRSRITKAGSRRKKKG